MLTILLQHHNSIIIMISLVKIVELRSNQPYFTWALEWRCHMGGRSFRPVLPFNCTTQWKVMPISHIRFLIFIHPFVPLFQQSNKSDPPFLSVKVNHYPFETKKKNCPWVYSNFMFETLWPQEFQILVFFQKKNSKVFHFFLMLKDPKKILKSKTSDFLEKDFRSSSTGSWQIPKGTKS